MPRSILSDRFGCRLRDRSQGGDEKKGIAARSECEDFADAAEPYTSSRRGFLKRGTALFAGTAAALALPDGATEAAAEGNEILAQLERANSDQGRRLLIKGGSIISMDPAIGNFVQADILVEGKKIAAVGPNLSAAAQAGKAIVVSAKDRIIIPGFADPHIHSWEGQLGRIIPNSNGVPDDAKHSYMSVTHRRFAFYYRPEDIYIGNLITALSCISAGITCVCDNSHNSRSSAHADAAVKALFDSGVRGVFAYGPALYGDWDHQWPKDLYRIKRQSFSSEDQLVTLRLMDVPPPAPGPDSFKVARDLDLWISFDGGGNAPLLPQFYRDGLLVGHESFNQGGGIPEANWQAIREYGAKINVCPRSDSQFRYGGANTAMNSIQEALDHGVRPGISNDNPTAYGIDMFEEMRTLYFLQRVMAQSSKLSGNPNPPSAITVRDALEFATIRGAECCGLDRKCGSLTPGKEADLLLIRINDIHLFPQNNIIGTVVQASTIGDVDAVFIAGQVRKWGGQMTSKLLGNDLSKIAKLADESREHLFAAAGWPLDPFSD